MSNKLKLTNSNVRTLATTGQDYKVWDTEVSGLHVRVTKAGSKSFAFFYRTADGRQRSTRIGKTTMTVTEARERARALRVQVDQGEDPSQERKGRLTAPTMADLWEAYLEQHAKPNKKPRSVAEDERLWRLHLSPRFAKDKVANVSVAEVRTMMSKMRETPGAANRSLALLSMMFTFAIQNEWRETNPCRAIKKYPENQVERYLSTNETEQLLTSCDADDHRTAARIIEFLILTGARKNEVFSMEWRQLEGLSSDTPTWVIDAGHQKGERRIRKVFRRQLSPEAADLLRRWKGECPTPSVRYVFPSPRKPEKAVTCINTAWERIRLRANLSDVRIHDLRHSFASFAVNNGAPLYSVGEALGHKDVKTTQRYAHLTDETVRGVASGVGALVGSFRGR